MVLFTLPTEMSDIPVTDHDIYTREPGGYYNCFKFKNCNADQKIIEGSLFKAILRHCGGYMLLRIRDQRKRLKKKTVYIKDRQRSVW